MAPIPVLLLTGFLGAGKTTLLRHLLRYVRAQEQRVSVVINEFGAVDVDGALLRTQEIEAIASVAGGCACCSGQEDFIAVLQELALRPEGQRPDAVIVESSGLADPVLLLEILASAELLPFVRPQLVLTLVDAANWNRAAASMADLLHRQVGLADWIFLNKADLVPEAAVTALTSKLGELNPHATLVPTVQGEADFAPLWSSPLGIPLVRTLEGKPAESNAHAAAHTFFCPIPHPIERSKLENALGTLGPEVWRAKGFLRLRGEPGLWLLQYVAGDMEAGHQLAPIHLPFGMDEPNLGVVFIGVHLSIADLTANFGGHRLLALF